VNALEQVFAQDLAQHYDAIIVGLFTLTGVYLTNRIARVQRRHGFVISALERIYSRAVDFRSNVAALDASIRQGALTLPDLEVRLREGRHDLEAIEMLIQLYVPRLAKHCAATGTSLADWHAAWRKRLTLDAADPPGSDPSETTEAGLQRFTKSLEALFAAIQNELKRRL
jgi:hypothetical protein